MTQQTDGSMTDSAILGSADQGFEVGDPACGMSSPPSCSMCRWTSGDISSLTRALSSLEHAVTDERAEIEDAVARGGLALL